MHEIALILLLLMPSWGILSAPHAVLTKIVAPKPQTTKTEPAKTLEYSPEPTKLTSEKFTDNAAASYSIDLSSGAQVDNKNELSKLQIASLTKLMTAYVILKDQGDLGKVVTVPSFELQPGDAVMGISPGDRLSISDLLAGLLIPSGSDAAQSLATIDAGSQANFVAKMNQKAKELGLADTHFANPVGWDDSDNYSTAKDLTNLTRVLLGNNFFAEITATKYKTVYTSVGRPIILTSTNELLGSNGYIGVKTGNTTGAGQCLVSLQEQNGHRILTTILGSTDRFGETASLNTWTNTHFLW